MPRYLALNGFVRPKKLSGTKTNRKRFPITFIRNKRVFKTSVAAMLTTFMARVTARLTSALIRKTRPTSAIATTTTLVTMSAPKKSWNKLLLALSTMLKID